MPDFDSMNETDVREAIVRPFLESLGYKHGTQATIRTEIPLRYDKSFLGRKKPAKDAALGKADYICEAISYGRWVVEFKAPSRNIRQDDIDQAHTYAAHPEIAALYFLVTNGRDYQLFMTSRLERPLLRWSYEDIEDLRTQICAILEFDAIKKYAARLTPPIGQPLGKGLPPRLQVLGGEVVYGQHYSDHPLLQNDMITDSVAPITEGFVERQTDGRIKASLRVLSLTGASRKLNERLGLDRFEFATSSAEISNDREAPTIFKNVQFGGVPEGEILDVPGMAPLPSPFAITFDVFSEAIGFLEEGQFKGIVSFDYQFRFHKPTSASNPMVQMILASVPETATLGGSGEFAVRFIEALES
ncbi:type I restriction enzyme HsdR N-terminal domain-containing protein [Sphingobium indicum]|uniref:type I restriction enzyme HsdR N-terminal domain-containing protein n=1 Tax=Sphingobium indicum TaxID=332055 RepID=UPI0009D965D0|nr:type I restriction enzyme HsdR N-terminal domain-containing protein [Sphingobium indicum]